LRISTTCGLLERFEHRADRDAVALLYIDPLGEGLEVLLLDLDEVPPILGVEHHGDGPLQLAIDPDLRAKGVLVRRGRDIDDAGHFLFRQRQEVLLGATAALHAHDALGLLVALELDDDLPVALLQAPFPRRIADDPVLFVVEIDGRLLRRRVDANLVLAPLTLGARFGLSHRVGREQ